MKFIKCIKGRALDVVVDVRSGSSTLQWHAEEPVQMIKKYLLFQKALQYGFQVPEAGSELLYAIRLGISRSMSWNSI